MNQTVSTLNHTLSDQNCLRILSPVRGCLGCLFWFGWLLRLIVTLVVIGWVGGVSENFDLDCDLVTYANFPHIQYPRSATLSHGT